jgi:hypothetical protein
MRDYALNTHRMRMRFDATRLPATYQAKLVDRFIHRLRMLSESERSVPVIAHVPLPAARMAPALQTRTPTAPDSRRVLVKVEPVAGRMPRISRSRRSAAPVRFTTKWRSSQRARERHGELEPEYETRRRAGVRCTSRELARLGKVAVASGARSDSHGMRCSAFGLLPLFDRAQRDGRVLADLTAGGGVEADHLPVAVKQQQPALAGAVLFIKAP